MRYFMENPHCNSVDYANGIPTFTTDSDRAKQKGRMVKALCKGQKQIYITIEQKNEYSLKKSGMLKLGLSSAAMTVAASVQAKPRFIVQEGRRKALTRQFLTSGTTHMPVPYLSITVC